ncbi:uncharacterized protein LOC128555177 [Mercenaria mercenaria]|uniref:uncharacterized protein LOC128555177 n=1 Tax=Mercenaria mercenaria TaxID=6596 RepID=UPI00234F62BB|nr:uncharacterized protein LOC128555177 [Mercenaria mercenaria]
MYSKRKSASFYLLTEKPILTGAPIDTTWQAGPLKATALWVNVFASDHPIFYEVTVRLAEGGEGDLIQWQETANTKVEIILEADELSGGVTIRFSIRAINFSGLFTTVSSDLFVAP